MNNFLLLTYYWPPTAGGGVHRWLKFSKYIAKYGWQPIIYTPLNPSIGTKDDSLLTEVNSDLQVIKTKIWEPYAAYQKLTGKKSNEGSVGMLDNAENLSLKQKFIRYTRGNFFIPDPRKYWINPSYKYLKNYISKNNVTHIVSTGPPHSMHLIALKLKLNNPKIKWVADFRDPWTNIDFYNQLMITKSSDRKYKKLERDVLQKADKVVTVSNAWAADFEKLGNRTINVIRNGFDEADYTSEHLPLDDSFTISHIGSMNSDRNPVALWKAMVMLKESNSACKPIIKLIGPVEGSVRADIKTQGLEDQVEFVDYMPHKEAIKLLQTSQILLLPINDTPNVQGVLPGKLYEYLGAKRPILCLAPKGSEAEEIINSSNSGKVFGYKESNQIKDQLLLWHDDYMAQNLNIKSNGYQQYSRANLAKQYAELLSTI